MGRRVVRTSGRARFFMTCLAAVTIALGAAACGVTGLGSVGDTLRASSVPAAPLAQLGEFEAVTTSPAGIDSVSALAKARQQDFGRDGDP